MNFADILSLFRQGQSTARSHIKNLIEMALIDGTFDLIEYNLLHKIAKRNNLTDADLKQIQQSPGKIQFQLPQDRQERFYQFFDLVHMMTIDKTIHEEEMRLCNLFAVKFGYSRVNADEIIESIQTTIRNGLPHEEAFQRVAWLV